MEKVLQKDSDVQGALVPIIRMSRDGGTVKRGLTTSLINDLFILLNNS